MQMPPAGQRSTLQLPANLFNLSSGKQRRKNMMKIAGTTPPLFHLSPPSLIGKENIISANKKLAGDFR